MPPSAAVAQRRVRRRIDDMMTDLPRKWRIIKHAHRIPTVKQLASNTAAYRHDHKPSGAGPAAQSPRGRGDVIQEMDRATSAPIQLPRQIRHSTVDVAIQSRCRQRSAARVVFMYRERSSPDSIQARPRSDSRRLIVSRILLTWTVLWTVPTWPV